MKNYLPDPQIIIQMKKYLSNLFEVREFKTVQNLVETTSVKKNLKQTIEAKTNKFNFARGGKELLCEKCSNTEFFWSVFSRFRTEYGNLRSKSPYSVRI